MTLFLFLLATVIVYVLLQYVLIPRLEPKGANGTKTIKGSALLAVSKYLSTTAFLAAVTYLLFLVLMFVLSLTSPVSSDELGAAVGKLQWFQSKFKIFREFWVVWVFLMLLLAYISYRRDKKAAAAQKKIVDQELPYLPPNEEMEEISRKIAECAQRARRLEQSWVRTDAELRIRQNELKRETDKLQVELHEADVRRRIPLPPPEQASQLNLRRFFASKGFFKTLQASTRSLGYIGTVLLALCVIGINAPVLEGHIENRVLHLDELQVEINKDEAKKSFDRAMSEAKNPAAPPLSPEDEQAIKETARLFEEFFTSSSDLQNDKDDDKKHIPFITRSQVVRDQIVTEFRRTPPNVAPPSNPEGPNSGSQPPNSGGDGGGPKRGGPGPERPSQPGDSGGSKRDGGGSPNAGGPGDSGGSGGSNGGGGGSPNTSGPDNSKEPKPAPPATDEQLYTLRERITRSDGGPQSALGESVADSLRKGVAGRPELLAKLKAKLAEFKASFKEPLVPLDLGKFAVGEAIGVAVDNSWQPPNELAGQVRKVGRAAFKDVATQIFTRAQRSGRTTFETSMKRMYETFMCRFFSDVAGPESLGDALAHVRDGVPQRPVMTHQESAALREVVGGLRGDESLFKELAESYKYNPAAMAYNEMELLENRKEADLLRKTVLNHKQKLTPEDITKVDSYEDQFPGRSGTDTPKSRLLAESGGSEPYSYDSTKLLAQSRDFSRLQQSPKLGGILMGRSPESATGDFRDLRWTMNDDSITLYLRRADGSEIAAGPFEKALIPQSLAYVADDRKVVVTIVTAGKDWRKVLLHPAFVDTRLGLDIIEFDKLVFRFVSNCDPNVKHWNKLVNGQVFLYDIALRLRQLSVLQRLESMGRLRNQDLAELNALTAVVDRAFNDAKIQDYLQAAIEDPEGMTVPERSVIAWGKAYFDPKLVDSLSGCASGVHGDLAAFRACLSSRLLQSTYQTSGEMMEKWFNPPPDLSPRSIAEELSYQSDNDLSFLKHESSGGAAENLWPFQFRYEFAFPAKAPDGTEPDSDSRKPWEFVQLRGLVANKVSVGVEADSELRSVYKRMRDFTTLQRLFRTSLEGKLGDSFPIEKLTMLMTATRGSVATVKTFRRDEAKPDKCE